VFALADEEWVFEFVTDALDDELTERVSAAELDTESVVEVLAVTEGDGDDDDEVDTDGVFVRYGDIDTLPVEVVLKDTKTGVWLITGDVECVRDVLLVGVLLVEMVELADVLGVLLTDEDDVMDPVVDWEVEAVDVPDSEGVSLDVAVSLLVLDAVDVCVVLMVFVGVT
jgi:hypothetical protein